MSEIQSYLTHLKIPSDRAAKYATALAKEHVDSVEDFKALEERDLLHEKISFSIGDLAKIRHQLVVNRRALATTTPVRRSQDLNKSVSDTDTDIPTFETPRRTPPKREGTVVVNFDQDDNEEEDHKTPSPNVRRIKRQGTPWNPKELAKVIAQDEDEDEEEEEQRDVEIKVKRIKRTPTGFISSKQAAKLMAEDEEEEESDDKESDNEEEEEEEEKPKKTTAKKRRMKRQGTMKQAAAEAKKFLSKPSKRAASPSPSRSSSSSRSPPPKKTKAKKTTAKKKKN